MSSGGWKRAQLLEALDRAIRQMSAQGVLFGQAVADRVGITGSDLECLDILHLRGVATAGALAEATGLTSGAITGILDRLEKAGLARRERDPTDRRKVLVRPLPAAQRRIAPLFEPLQRDMIALWSGYGDDQLALLVDFAERSHRILTERTAALRAKPRTAPRRRPVSRKA